MDDDARKDEPSEAVAWIHIVRGATANVTTGADNPL